MFLFVSCCLLLLFLSSAGLFSQPFITFNRLISDEVSLWLGFITVVVSFLSYLVVSSFSWLIVSTFFFMLFSSFGVFVSWSFFLLYFFYEFSLLPILYLILKWGSYPDRSTRVFYMLFYTVFFRMPLMLFLFWWSAYFYSFILFSYGVASSYFPAWSLFFILFAFAVKLPLYGAHHWLPLAHVEAPTYGSIILAGILLKIGGCGLLRFFSVLHFPLVFKCCVVSYCVVSLVVVSILTSYQSDLKRLVAFSSVVHMSIIVVAIFSGVGLAYKALLFLIVTHAFSSPLMFMLVGVVYRSFNTRLILLVRGILLLSPQVFSYFLLVFLMNVPTPPFRSFLAELYMFLGVFFMSYSVMGLVIFLYVFLAIVFNIYWFSSVSFGSSISSSFVSCYRDYIITFVLFTFILALSFMLALF